MHFYFDVSDLNAPYDQVASARPLQGVGTHLYRDQSNLNAQYDRSRPAIHGFGAGSLGGNALGAGAGAIDASQCTALTHAHDRMREGLPGTPKDTDLIAQWERLTREHGCPVLTRDDGGNRHLFWADASTLSWFRRGTVPAEVEAQWDRIDPESWYVPPFMISEPSADAPPASAAEPTVHVVDEITIYGDPNESMDPTGPSMGTCLVVGAVGVAAVLVGGAFYLRSR